MGVPTFQDLSGSYGFDENIRHVLLISAWLLVPDNERYAGSTSYLSTSLEHARWYVLWIHWPARMQIPWLTIVFLHNSLTVMAQEEPVLLGKLLGGTGNAKVTPV